MKEHSNKDYWLYIIWIVYAIFVGIAISKHEPWFDEAQCWLLARDASLMDLLTKYLRYDGSTGLWFLILFVPSKLNFPYYSMNIISGIFATIGVYLLLRYSPFPLVIKILMPFSFFIFFQYGVIARSYVLLPILLFMIAKIYENKTEKVYLFIFYLCLIANVNVHGLLIAISIFFIHIIDLTGEWGNLDRLLKIKQVKAYSIFLIIVILLILQLWLPRDLVNFAPRYIFGIDNFIATSREMINNSFTENIYISTLIFITSLFWFLQKRLLSLYLILILPMLILFSVIYRNVWHEGILFLIWIFVMWISFEPKPTNNCHNLVDKLLKREKNFIVLLMIIVLSFHIHWAFNSIRYDFLNSYSASYDVANYIKTNNLEEKKIYATSFHAISILPYFDNNIFSNYNNKQKPCFWLWSTKNNMIQDIKKIIKDKPDLIIIGVKFKGQEKLPVIPQYKFVGMFDGNIYWKNRILEKDSFGLFRREQSP